MMRNVLARWIFIATASVLVTQVHAEVDAKKAAESIQLEKERIREDTAAIKTKDDLIRHLTDTSATNPLNMLSVEARERLLDTLVVNDNGELASLYTADIRTELTPSQVYRVFSLFGHPEAAGVHNNGQSNQALDAEILKRKQTPQVISHYKYCNGGYCTSNDAFDCYINRCNPSR